MAIEIWRPRGLRRGPTSMGRLESEMEDMFSGFLGGWPWVRRTGESLGWAPAMDVVNRKEEILLRADLPGMTEKDIQLTVDNGNLMIQGERKEEQEEKDENYYCCERSYGSFSRSLALPTGVNGDRINASFRNGVLEVHLPKTKESSGKKIEIKAA